MIGFAQQDHGWLRNNRFKGLHGVETRRESRLLAFLPINAVLGGPVPEVNDPAIYLSKSSQTYLKF